MIPCGVQKYCRDKGVTQGYSRAIKPNQSVVDLRQLFASDYKLYEYQILYPLIPAYLSPCTACSHRDCHCTENKEVVFVHHRDPHSSGFITSTTHVHAFPSYVSTILPWRRGHSSSFYYSTVRLRSAYLTWWW
jgi:hypothetical protein